MPTYESENGWIAIGNQKNYWSVYTCSAEKISKYQTEIYKDSFTVKVGNKIKIIKTNEVICFYSFENATYLKKPLI